MMNTAVRGTRRKTAAARRKTTPPSGKSQLARDVDASVDITDSTDTTDTGSNATSDKNDSEIPANDVKEVCEVIDVDEKPNASADDPPDDSREEETVTKADETPQIIDEFELKLADDDMVIDESNEGDEAECILEDFVLIDSEDGNDDAVPTIDTDSDNAQPSVTSGTSDDDMVVFLKSLGLKGAVGFLELSIAGVPLIHIVEAETREVREQRKVVLHLLKPLDFASPVLQDILNSDKCIHVRMECDRPLNDIDSWTGDLELYFASAAAASSAAESLANIREGIQIDSGQTPSIVEESAAEKTKILAEEMKPWIDLILIVKNIGSTSESCKSMLAEMFPDADIAFHNDSASELLKGQAYLVFNNKQQVDEAINKFKREKTRLNDRRLVLIRWNPKRILPTGMLRVGERRLVMLTMLQMEGRLAKGDDSSLNAQYKALGDVVARDTKARHACGIPAPSYNQLKGLHDVRHYSDAEQSLILHRLLQPYNCGDVDVGRSIRAPAKSPITSPSTVKKFAAKANTMTSASTTPVEKNDTKDVTKSGPGSDTEKKPTGFDLTSKSLIDKRPPWLKNRVTMKPVVAGNRRLATVAAAKTRLRMAGAVRPRSLLEMSMQPRKNVGFSLLGVRPPRQRMPGPLLRAPFELLPAPSSMGRGAPPSSPPLRPLVRTQAPVGFRREMSPPTRGSLLGNYPGELETGGARGGARPLNMDRREDPMSKMRHMEDERRVVRRPSPGYDRRPSYMEEEQDRFRSDLRAGPMSGRMPDDRDDRPRKAISIFDIDDRLRREDVERGHMGDGDYRMGPENFGRRHEEDEMMEMDRGRPQIRGSVDRRMSGWDNGRAAEREPSMPYDRIPDDRRMMPKNRPVPSLLDTMDHDFAPDRKQPRMQVGMDSMRMQEQSPKGMGRGPPVQDDFKPPVYYQNEPRNMAPSSRMGIMDHSSPYSRDRDDRSSWASERSDRFMKFEPEQSKPTPRQPSQPSQSGSEQSDPVSLLLNLSQLLADKLQREKEKDKTQHQGDY